MTALENSAGVGLTGEELGHKKIENMATASHRHLPDMSASLNDTSSHCAPLSDLWGLQHPSKLYSAASSAPASSVPASSASPALGATVSQQRLGGSPPGSSKGFSSLWSQPAALRHADSISSVGAVGSPVVAPVGSAHGPVGVPSGAPSNSVPVTAPGAQAPVPPILNLTPSNSPTYQTGATVAQFSPGIWGPRPGTAGFAGKTGAPIFQPQNRYFWDSPGLKPVSAAAVGAVPTTTQLPSSSGAGVAPAGAAPNGAATGNQGHSHRVNRSSNTNSRPTKKNGRPSTNTELYKTELCASYMSTGGNCPYGEKCQFAHGREELKAVDRPPKWRSKPCQNWVKTGSCSYNERCCFRHDVAAVSTP